MAKGIMSVTVDGEVLDYHRARGTNLSKTVNDYLKALMGDELKKTDNVGELINKLETDLAKAKLEQAQREQVIKVQAEQAQKEEFKDDIEYLRELYRKKEEGSKLAEKRYFEALNKIKEVYGLNSAQVLDYITYKKAV